MRFRIFLFLGPLLAVGCSSSVDAPAGDNGDGGTGGDTASGGSACTANVTIDSPSVIELRAKAPSLALTTADSGGIAGDHPLKVVLTQGGKPVKTLFDKATPLGSTTVDLPSDSLSPGAYGIEATLGCPAEATSKTEGTAKKDVFVVRLGATKVAVAGDGRVPLMYHSIGGATGAYYPIDEANPVSSLAAKMGEADLDDATGKARAFEPPWAKLDTPPQDDVGSVLEDGVTYPIALTVDTKPQVTLTLGKSAFVSGKVVPGGVGTTGLPDIRVVLDGAPKSETKITDGGTVTFTLDSAPATNVGQYDLTLTWHFEVKDGSSWKEIPGATQSTKIKVYGVLGNEIGTAYPNLPWVTVVDAVTKEIAGKTKDPVEVRKMLVRLVYEDFGLAYDRKSGASAYTNYTGGGSASWVKASFDLSSFVKINSSGVRAKGNIVNCTDCASILSTYANMVGVKLHYAIIGWNFGLNPIQGIGATSFGSPFDSGRMGFSYHAVTTPDATVTIDDATLVLDGDSDPTTAPYTKLLVQDVAGTEYLTRLSTGSVVPEYKYADQITSVR
ncbi:MAG: hypothetical protein ACXWP4_09950 [Polyangiales bacterium]